ncbi:FAD-dependent oxidoreductase [Frankia sp. Cr1]|uniref:FAD-dependent oxidoreductase n=1 Tax=Frankia sp. Cr1 TaxID=3073931 RepID=UPI002AD530D8|nr:FAD-dependent oxidoreductase [Frankia sp. Cr1]
MPDTRTQILVVGSGLCGLAITATAARRGLRVRCVGDGQPGASLANFGQLHSGAVYAPVLPEVARACWSHRDRWHDLALPAQVGKPYGYAIFSTTDAVDNYRAAWRQIGIDAPEVDPRSNGTLAAYPPAVAAFRIPDLSVDLDILHTRTTALALAVGAPPIEHAEVSLHRDPDTTLVSAGPDNLHADLVILATGANTPTMLNNAGITHTLRRRRIAWGRYNAAPPTCLTYWLDGDLLAISPDTDNARIGLPSVNGAYATDEAEYTRIRTALDHRHIYRSDRNLSLHWGTVCEPANTHADPSNLVVDLRDPPTGWSKAANLIIALPGKWTTAWYCAEQVINALG